MLQELNGAGVALRWVDLEAFARRAIDMETGDRNRVAYSQDWVFFDRGLLDAAIALEHATGLAASVSLSGHARFRGIEELRDMLRAARMTPETWHEFLDDFVHDAELVARIKAQSPR